MHRTECKGFWGRFIFGRMTVTLFLLLLLLILVRDRVENLFSHLSFSLLFFLLVVSELKLFLFTTCILFCSSFLLSSFRLLSLSPLYSRITHNLYC